MKQSPQDEDSKEIRANDVLRSFGNLGALTSNQQKRIISRPIIEDLTGDNKNQTLISKTQNVSSHGDTPKVE